ncbi:MULTISPECIES: hypothetical protein [unclassified Legionella]|uniref:hypothetical protein n=1 Tax=unclassified Legionella TaxID=2622702 RepID=UPI0010546DA9|nr:MULTISPECIES: hypothetical protein [unclassified Legionella]MDI9818314.1 hypothetical protein [Legionella sp. PL877]
MSTKQLTQKFEAYKAEVGKIKEGNKQLSNNWLIEENIIEKEDLQILRKDMQLSLGNSTQKKQAEEEEEEENKKKNSLWLTTWSNRETGQLLAFSLGVNGRGSEVHDVSHLNISLDDFMNRVGSILRNSSSYHDAKKAIEKEYSGNDKAPFSSVDDYEQSRSSSVYKTPRPTPFKEDW